MSRKKQVRLKQLKHLDESYCFKFGNFNVYVEVPESGDNESRMATKSAASKFQSVLMADKEGKQ